MTSSIIGVDTSGNNVTFTVLTDATGCDEDFSTTIDGQKFTQHITLNGGGPHPDQSIPHTKGGAGNRVIKVCAETSKVCSENTAVNL